jgi:hypothetical protein
VRDEHAQMNAQSPPTDDDFVLRCKLLLLSEQFFD